MELNLKNTFIKKASVFLSIVVIGFVMGILGSSTFLTIQDIAPLWPAAALQALSGFLFDLTGIFAGLTFSLLSNVSTGIPIHLAFYILPANIIQCLLPFLVKKLFKIKPYLFNRKTIFSFVILCVIIPNILGALWISRIDFFLQHQTHSQIFFSWLKSNIPVSIIFGLILLKTLAPALKNCHLYPDEE